MWNRCGGMGWAQCAASSRMHAQVQVWGPELVLRVLLQVQGGGEALQAGARCRLRHVLSGQHLVVQAAAAHIYAWTIE